MNNSELIARRDIEHTETRLVDLLDEHGEILTDVVEAKMIEIAERKCECPGCQFLYHVLYLGLARTTLLQSERRDRESE